MQSTVFFIVFILLTSLLILHNIVSLFTSPITAGINIVLGGVILIVGIIYAQRSRASERYSGYNYDQENPNALVTGKEIAGAVYASYPQQVGGLGWVL